MRESELKKVRREYYKLKKASEELLQYRNELLELEKNEKVKRYLELLEIVNKGYKGLTEENLVSKAFDLCSHSIGEFRIDSNQIMVYIGTYIKDRTNDGDIDDYITYDNNPNASYKAYLDLETQEAYNITLDKCEEFENEYLAIYLSVDEYNEQEYMKNYFNLQKWFREQIIHRSQQDVIAELQEQPEIKYKKLHDACINYSNQQDENEKLNVAEFVEKYAENGFIESFCISKEEQKRVKLYRKQNHT